MTTTLKALRSFLSSLAVSRDDGLETYLSQSQSLADLERRERQWHRDSADRALSDLGVRSH
jgi:hypothetical protein